MPIKFDSFPIKWLPPKFVQIFEPIALVLLLIHRQLLLLHLFGVEQWHIILQTVVLLVVLQVHLVGPVRWVHLALVVDGGTAICLFGDGTRRSLSTVSVFGLIKLHQLLRPHQLLIFLKVVVVAVELQKVSLLELLEERFDERNVELAVDREGADDPWLLVVALAFLVGGWLLVIEEAGAFAADSYADELLNDVVHLVELLEAVVLEQLADDRLEAAALLADEGADEAVFPEMVGMNVQVICDLMSEGFQ